ncbi:peptidoglycan-binding protein [Streptomyces sp. NPDC005708]|uniref:peptidoglycan-binding protein n=1 Tax=Streptomyces sp. NPDC005708 TaxID=3154564 RepID=UPI0034030AA1
MSGTNGQTCPECAAPRRPDGTPSCGCTRRASEALRDARTAEAAAAEDFDPLRIRPYVELAVPATEVPGDPGRAAEAPAAGAAAPDETMRLAAVREDTGRPAPGPEGAGGQSSPEGAQGPATEPAGTEGLGTGPDTARRTAADTDGTARGAAADETVVLPGAGESVRPTAVDETVRLAAVPPTRSAVPEGAAGPEETMRLGAVPGGTGENGAHAAPAFADEEPAGRSRRTVLLAAGGAVVVIAAAAALVGGLLSYKSPQRDGALPEGIRASVPEASSPSEVSAPPSTVSAAAPSVSAPPSPTSSPSPSVTYSASPTPSVSAAPSRSATTARASGSPSPTSGSDAGPVLRPGDEGPEVTELQLRLRQLNLHSGKADGEYDSQVEYAVRTYQFARGVTGDEYGVYGPATRLKLESETTEP